MRVIGLILVPVMVGLGFMNGGSLFQIIDIPSALIVVGATLGIAWQAGTPIRLLIRSFFSSNLTPDEIRTAATGWAQMRVFLLIAGIIGTFVGVINLFQVEGLSQSEKVLYYVHTGTATAVITTFYAVFLSYAVFLPLQRRLEAQMEAAGFEHA